MNPQREAILVWGLYLFIFAELLPAWPMYINGGAGTPVFFFFIIPGGLKGTSPV